MKSSFRVGQYADMSKVTDIESELEKLSHAELRQVRDWLDDLIEDGQEFTTEFESSLQRSESEMADAVRPRTRQP